LFYKIAILLTCHNRKEKTYNCLLNIFKQIGFGNQFEIDIFLVDDYSTDGTYEVIQSHFPKVNIIQGNGYLYWNRGMHLAWETAASFKEFDYYLWLNDDTYLFNNALNILLDRSSTNSIIVGSTKSINFDIITYGGFKNNKLLFPNENLQEVDYFNGNCVLIPNSVYQILGNLDINFHHALGDFDYGLRAKKFGIKMFISNSIVGTCESHIDIPNWRNTKHSIYKRFYFLYKPNSGCNPFEYFYFDLKHKNIAIAILHFCSIHLRCFLPILWKL